jgi:hypothetical protein
MCPQTRLLPATQRRYYVLFHLHPKWINDGPQWRQLVTTEHFLSYRLSLLDNHSEGISENNGNQN